MGFLVLKRDVGQSIVINPGTKDEVVIKILNAVDNHGRITVSVGVNAPRDIPVHREEVQQRLKNGETPRILRVIPSRTASGGC